MRKRDIYRSDFSNRMPPSFKPKILNHFRPRKAYVYNFADFATVVFAKVRAHFEICRVDKTRGARERPEAKVRGKNAGFCTIMPRERADTRARQQTRASSFIIHF